FSGVNYQSLQDNNIGNEPDTSPTFWLAGVSAGLPFSTSGATANDVGRAVRLFYQPPAWSAAITYSAGNQSGQVADVVTYQGAYYQALFTNTTQGDNINQVPP